MPSSVDTPASLLERLRQPGDDDAWLRFVQLYTPLLFHWAGRVGLKSDDAKDLVQDVLLVLIQKLPEFRYDASKSFRGWLRTVTLNRWRERQRRSQLPHQPGEINLSDLAAQAEEGFWEEEYREHLARRALQLMQTDFDPAAWKACLEIVVNERPAAEVAAELGMSVKAVYHAKYRVLRRLRQELAGFLD